MSNIVKKKRKLKGNKQNFDAAKEMSFGEAEGSMDNNDLNDTLNQNKGHSNEQSSEKKIKDGEVETMGESVDDNMPRPYEFLKFAQPPLHTIFVPHFTVKSLTFILTMVYLITFIVLLIYSYTKPNQNKLTWNCSLFQLQNKYYPKIRFEFQFWRVIISGIFHSNIAHFILNVLGLQIYGYFVEWYYGKLKYGLTLLCAVIISHFFGCVALPVSVSTTSSSVLYAVMALKLYFFYEYWSYKQLANRKIFLYVLFALILGINIIPILVNNNVDFTAHLGGLMCGGLMGLFFHYQREEKVEKVELVKWKKALKFGSLVIMTLLCIIFLVLMFSKADENRHLETLSETIGQKCKEE